MGTDHEYSLQELADLAEVTPRTIRYYLAQGLLPSPGKFGPGTTYSDGHLARLRLIRRLAGEHMPLAEIRSRLAGLDDEAIAALARLPAAEPASGSAIDYIRGLIGPDLTLGLRAARQLPPSYRRVEDAASPIPDVGRSLNRRADIPFEPAPRTLHSTGPERSQWERLALAPDVELHVRRPLTRHQNKRVERLISIARTIFEGDPS